MYYICEAPDELYMWVWEQLPRDIHDTMSEGDMACGGDMIAGKWCRNCQWAREAGMPDDDWPGWDAHDDLMINILSRIGKAW